MISSIPRFKRPRRVSKKRRKENAIRFSPEVEGVVKGRSGGRCELRCSPDCLGRGDHMHEINSCGQCGSRTDPGNALWSCWPCNFWVHNHPIKAALLGVLFSKKHEFRPLKWLAEWIEKREINQ